MRLCAIAVVVLGVLLTGALWGQETVAEPVAEAPAVTTENATGEEAAVAGETTTVEEFRGTMPLADRFRQGGLTMVFLLVLSVAAVTFTLERAFRLRRAVVYPVGLAERAKELWAAGEFEKLRQVCAANPSTLSTIIEALIRHRRSNALELSNLAGDIAGRDLRGHLQRAYPLAVIATLAPLLGLLGTVIGMIESFEVVAIAGSLGDASLLAGGISKALVTTALGLIVAVPALALFHFFKSRTNTFAMGLEGDVNELITTWFLERSEQKQVVADAR